MAWEMRGKHGPYYTRSVRRNGLVEREYYGKGPTAVAMAQLDLLRTASRAEERLRARRDASAASELDGLLDDLGRITDQATRTLLEAAGYQQHKRGEWRRRRG